ncbi:MAG: amidase [Pseudohongiellaceae bacterium]
MTVCCLPPVLLVLAGSVRAQDAHEVLEAGISETQRALNDGVVTSRQLVDSYLARIEAYDNSGPGLNSLIRLNPEARAQAQALDREREDTGARGPLHGIPIILKDNYNTTTLPTSGGSVALAGFVPSANATAVERLLAAGAIILGKSNLHEFAYGITTVGSLQGQTRNPYDIRRMPGGSSGGTAAAVAASFATVGMGSDTCGSIRIPSAFNNLVGLRSSKGMTSIHGIMPLSHTQDVVGPLARSTEDVAIVLDVIAGYDENDPATVILQGREPPGFVRHLQSASLSGLRLGRLENYFDQADPAVNRVIENTLERLREAGVEIVAIETDDLGPLISRSGLIGFEFMPDLNQYLSLFLSEAVPSLDAIVDQGLYHEAVGGVLLRSQAAVADEAAYQDALAGREVLREAVQALMREHDVDALVYPPIGSVPAFAGESQPGNNCSLSANSGLPALSVPAGFTGSGLPIGLELLGDFLDDARLLAIGHRIEQTLAMRQAPPTTPALIDGDAPPPQRIDLSLLESGLRVEAGFVYSLTSAALNYGLTITNSASEELYAVTLVIDEPDTYELNDPVVANLAGPGTTEASGTIAVTPALRAALREGRVYVKAFASQLPVAGVAGVLASAELQ